MKKSAVILFLVFLTALNGNAQVKSSSKSTFMIRHTVVFNLKYPKGSPEESEFFNATSLLVGIPVVKNFTILRETSTKNDFEYCFSMEFDSMKAYEEYNENPDHVKFVQDYWVKYVDEFLELDYEPFE